VSGYVDSEDALLPTTRRPVQRVRLYQRTKPWLGLTRPSQHSSPIDVRMHAVRGTPGPCHRWERSASLRIGASLQAAAARTGVGTLPPSTPLRGLRPSTYLPSRPTRRELEPHVAWVRRHCPIPPTRQHIGRMPVPIAPRRVIPSRRSRVGMTGGILDILQARTRIRASGEGLAR
jgi:hypothetical protein